MSLHHLVRAALAVVVLSVLGVTQASAEGPRVRSGLFQNYYVQPSRFGGVGAEMYPSPHPVPAWVGGSYYTYRGLYPHEHMYRHMKHYFRPTGSAHILYW
jgi:hypothetical protein